jgi:hypothetical protein
MISPNIYLFGIGETGTGKSPAFSHALREPLQHIERERGCELLYGEFTRGGLFYGLSKNGGMGVVASDEVGAVVKKMISDVEFKGTREMLNSFFTGGGYISTYATKDKISIPKGVLSLAGMMQPCALVAYLQEVYSIDTGLGDRILTVSVSPRRVHDDDIELHAQRMEESNVQSLT